ncbi:hypothetical protein [Paenibacillus koleovorans]|uniref:hypothetical protein n=1 Tax=Paenibacillus koleovorans TaxID=121608 RepID=UPI000FDBAFE6|nr:hypothetical protein [Paenibacillus koleovorans]
MQKNPTVPKGSPHTNSTATLSQQSTKMNGKSPSKSSNALQGCIGCLGFGIVLLIVGVFVASLFSMNEDDPTVSPQPTMPRVAGTTSIAKQDNLVEQQVRTVISKTAGTKSSVGGERIMSLQVNEHQGTTRPDDHIVVATLLADNAGGSTKSRMQFQSMDVFKQLFAMSTMEEVTIIWQLPLVDTYGKVENKPVMKITIDRTTAAKINWDNFNRNNFSQVANGYFEHATLQNDN